MGSSEFSNKSKLKEQISSFFLLEDGWDGEAAKNPSIGTIENTLLVVQQLDDKLFNRCSAFPSNDFGIYLQGIANKIKFTIYINNDQMIYIIRTEDKLINKCSDSINTNSILLLNKFLTQYIE